MYLCCNFAAGRGVAPQYRAEVIDLLTTTGNKPKNISLNLMRKATEENKRFVPTPAMISGIKKNMVKSSSYCWRLDSIPRMVEYIKTKLITTQEDYDDLGERVLICIDALFCFKDNESYLQNMMKRFSSDWRNIPLMDRISLLLCSAANVI